MTMDYNSPWSEREIWPFLKVAVSLKSKRSCPPKLVYMHFTSTYINMNFLSRFQSIKFFDDEKGNLAVFEGNNISKTRDVMPTKIGVHVCNINP